MIAHHHAAAGSGGLFLTLKDRRCAVAPVSTHLAFFFVVKARCNVGGPAGAVKPPDFPRGGNCSDLGRAACRGHLRATITRAYAWCLSHAKFPRYSYGIATIRISAIIDA